MKKGLKKKIYLILWVVTGILSGVLVAGIIELNYINQSDTTNYMFFVVYSLMILIGVMLGLWVGPKAWQKIYIEGKRGKKYI